MKNRSGKSSENFEYEPVLIIVPCFNESLRFNQKYFENLIGITGTVWFFVDDGSKDETFPILQALCTFANSHVLRLSNNVGKSEAIRIGLLDALNRFPSSSWCGFLDSDGAFDSTEVAAIINRIINKEFDSFQALFSSRVKLSGRKIHRETYRHLIGRAVATIFGLIWKDIPYDTQSGFKIFRSNDLLKEIILIPFQTRWFFDIEIIARIAEKQQLSPLIWEEPLNSWMDIKGSKISIREIFRLAGEVPRVAFLLANKRKYLNGG